MNTKPAPDKPIVDISYEDATAMILEHNGGYAPLHLIGRELGKYKDLSVTQAKTPFHTVQAILQRKTNRFVRIALGVYALKDYQEQGKLKLPKPDDVVKDNEEKTRRQHSEIEGKLLSLGNHLGEVADTYTADKGRLFSGGELGKIATLSKPHPFTYKDLVRKVSLMDVVWFNERKFPSHFFEVEHTTDFGNALMKFCDLQDFRAKFICVADERRRDKFNSQINRAAFVSIRELCRFKTYEEIEDAYAKRQQPVI